MNLILCVLQPEKAMGLLTYTEKNMFGKSPEKEREKEKEDPGGDNSWEIWRPILSVVGCNNDTFTQFLTWVKVYRIIPEFSILMMTFHRKSSPKC